jgi:hypothetical protein
MDAKIDYLSFTLPINLSGAGHSPDAEDMIVAALEHAGCGALLAELSTGKPERRGGRKIYAAGIFFQTQGVSLWFGGVANHLLVEVSGTGCQALRDAGILEQTLAAVQTRTTRIDVAVDLPDAGQPEQFVSKKMENRFRVTETQDTDTGWTQYVGSRKSERFARVYLYRAPHPRAGVLRVEHVLRAEYAKSAAAAILDTSLSAFVAVLGNTWGWQHERWQPDIVTEGKLRAQRHDKEDAATVRWLAKAVAPALVKAHRSGLIDLNEWLNRNVLALLE